MRFVWERIKKNGREETNERDDKGRQRGRKMN